MSDQPPASKVSFPECLLLCLLNDDLLSQHDRLAGTNLCRQVQPIELMVDDASGRTEADLATFTEFVREVVWDRLPPDVRSE